MRLIVCPETLLCIADWFVLGGLGIISLRRLAHFES